jgi:hypothetical protein
MKLLFENWRKYLKEGRELENFTTLISREVINALKEDEIKEIFNNNGEVSFGLDTEEMLKNLTNVRNVYINLEAADYVYAHAKYDFILDATEEQRKESDVYINILLPLNYEHSVFSELIPELKDSLRHELEHSTQPTDILMKVQREIPDGDIWKSLESAKTYYTSESETKAHIAGIYKKAKTLKEPVGSVLDQVLMEIWQTGISNGYSEEELGVFLAKLREMWRYYLMSRYPQAEIDLKNN